MRPIALALFAATTFCITLGVAAQTPEWKTDDRIITFNAPGPSPGTTIPAGINPKGVITGSYQASGINRGFLRDKDGTITTFDISGTTTSPSSINEQGEITGDYGNGHSFLRDKDGTITTFDVSSAIIGNYAGTFAESINPEGEIVGYTGPIYYKGPGLEVGFLRHKDGTITTFKVPGSTATLVSGINPGGEIAGYYYVGMPGSLGGERGFLRDKDGAITKLEILGPGPYATKALSINPGGEITGYYYDANNAQASAVRSFLRDKDGAITTFDAPGAATGNFEGTFAVGINPSGEITGNYDDANGVVHGFVRARDGIIARFDAPGATYTFPLSINPSGEITGYYIDANGFHGFLRQSNHHDRPGNEPD